MNIPVTYDWEKFKQYAERCHIGSYQVIDTQDNEHKEIKVLLDQLESGLKEIWKILRGEKV
jgi:hypothetical protein